MNTAFSSLDVSPINPFALMTDPRGVLDAVLRSDRLNALASQVHRPLDKPTPLAAGDLDAFDRLVDAADSAD